MPTQLRAAVEQDAIAVAAIDARVSVSPWSLEQFQAFCGAAENGRYSALVLEAGNLIEGFVVFSRVLDEATILNIAVDESCQRRGLGRALLRVALQQMKRGGAVRCLLEVRHSNVAARSLYQAHDFQLDGVRKNYYPTAEGREDALLMSREL